MRRLTCEQCGKEFVTDKRGRIHCCSPECKAAHTAVRKEKQRQEAEAEKKRQEAKKPAKSFSQFMREAEEHGFGNHYGAYIAFLEKQKAAEKADGHTRGDPQETETEGDTDIGQKETEAG